MVLSPDGKLLYVAERLDDRIAVINTETLETVGNIGPGRAQEALRWPVMESRS